MTPKQMARLGIFHLQEAVLAILEDAPPEGLEPGEISRLLGIPPCSEVSLSYAIVHGILDKLKNQGLTQRVNGTSRWQLQQ